MVTFHRSVASHKWLRLTCSSCAVGDNKTKSPAKSRNLSITLSVNFSLLFAFLNEFTSLSSTYCAIRACPPPYVSHFSLSLFIFSSPSTIFPLSLPLSFSPHLIFPNQLKSVRLCDIGQHAQSVVLQNYWQHVSVREREGQREIDLAFSSGCGSSAW